MQIEVSEAIAGLDFQYTIDQDDMIQDAVVILRMMDAKSGRFYSTMTFTAHTDQVVLDGLARVYEDKRALQPVVILNEDED